MKTQKEKMLAGELYDASDAQLAAERRNCRLLTAKLNQIGNDEPEQRSQILAALLPNAGATSSTTQLKLKNTRSPRKILLP